MSDSSTPKAGGLWSRLFSLTEEDDRQDEAAAASEANDVPAPPAEVPAPVAAPAESAVSPAPAEVAAAPPIEEPDEPETPTLETPPPAPAPAPPLATGPQPCPACGTVAKPTQKFCEDCGWMFGAAPVPLSALEPVAAPVANAPGSPNVSLSPNGPAAPINSASPSSPRGPEMSATAKGLLRNRYEMRQLIGERQGTQRFRGFDHTGGQAVVIVATAAATPEAASELPIAEAAVVEPDEIMPGFDDDVPVAAVVVEGAGTEPATSWPSVAWEKSILEKANHPALPRVLESFADNGTEYLIVDQPIGNSLWDAWDEAEDANTRYGWAKHVAEALHALHQAGAILEGVRPDLVVVNDSGIAVLADLSDLLPLPVPASPPLRANLFTAPELILNPQSADARSDLYSFGALLYSLEYLHHSPEEKDFEAKFVPRQITDRYPDVHPLILRLVNKTFVRDVNTRFPTDEAGRTDPTGFTELIKTLDVCRRTFDQVRLDVAAWTTTGMVRTGNEDAFSVLHAVEQRQDELNEFVAVFLCDGMGGYEAGEVAAALAMSKMREFVLQQPMFAALAGKEPPANAPDVKALQEVMNAALRHANKEVYTASRTPGKGRRGMGCTAECVYIDTRNVVVGHVGDSRTYHLRRGRLLQLTRDQTFVNRMVELGQLSAAEAENHPRKNELQQAIGGQPDVVPGVSASKLQPGDWVLVCSDGLTNHISNAELEKMLSRECSESAQAAARRLLNLTNLRGATDNATIVVVRAS